MKKIFTLCVLCIFSCESETRELGRVEKALVFGLRNVEQVRGTMSRASSEPEGSDERDYAYQAAQLARATATIYPTKYVGVDCTIQGQVASSATLTSDSRMVTAWHGIQGVAESFPAYFESESISYNLGSSAVGAIRADASVSLYNAAWEQTTAHRSDVVEESPFLANRLFVLGLDSWAKQGPGTHARIGLRSGFHFEMDTIGPSEIGYNSATAYYQGFMHHLGDDYVGRDIAILRVDRNNKVFTSDFSLLGSGSFDITKPAVFFGQVRMGDTDQHPIKPTNYLNHTASWPDSVTQASGGSNGVFVPLTSFLANYDTILEEDELTGCEEPFTRSDILVTNLFQTTFDSTNGSSGGLILTPHSLPRPQYHTKRPLIGMAVLSGARTTKANHPWAEGLDLGDFGEHFVSFTGLLPNDIELLSRDTVQQGDPSQPTPFIEGNDPECKTYNGDFCTSFVTTPAEGGGESAPKRPEGVEVLDGAKAEIPGEGVGRRFFCSNHSIGKPPGIMVGIHGGLALNGVGVGETAETVMQNGGGVGSFMGICTPYSSRPYTDNWRFIKIIGAQMPRSLDTLGGPFGWGSFDGYQSRVYEERLVEDEVQVRPPSTKMCPPNYLLRGVELTFETSGQYYSGVKAIYCAKGTPDADGPEELALSLVEDESNYTLAGKPFDLTQNIGYPDSCLNECCQGECLSVTCPENEVVIGFETFHDNVGRLTFLDARCIKNPYQ